MALKFPQLHVVENNKKSLGIYVHIPFCRSKCEYCDFYSLPGARDKDRMDEYTAALVAHIREAATGANGYEVDTVYFGGGTPSFFGAGGLARIFAEIDRRFDVSRDAEVTFEANPDSVTLPMLTHLRRAGFNRISIGVQSDLDEQLKALGRPHNYKQAQQAVSLARRAGFDNLSVDLMYGLPNQTQAQFLDSVTQCLTLNPQHLSCYGLKLEPATPMGRENPVLPDDDTQADTYLAMCRLLGRNGFEHYEISNFAKPGFRSRHNFKYWDLSDYLGLGPGAHSFLNGRRFAFARDIRAYISGESIPQDEEEVSDFRRQGVARALILALTEELKNRGSHCLTLEVRASNDPARALYESLGFVLVGTRRNYYHNPKEDALILRKEWEI